MLFWDDNRASFPTTQRFFLEKVYIRKKSPCEAGVGVVC